MKPTDLRGILRYIPRFREKVFVVALNGAIVTNDNFPNLLLDLAVLRSLNIRIVLVHGAAAQIAAMGSERGVKPSNLDGTGITDAATLGLSLTAANRLTHEILEGLATNDLRAVSTNAVIAQIFGIAHMSMLGGFVFMSHQVGSFMGVWLGGVLYDLTGKYDSVWYLAIALGVFAGLINLPVRETAIPRQPQTA